MEFDIYKLLLKFPAADRVKSTDFCKVTYGASVIMIDIFLK